MSILMDTVRIAGFRGIRNLEISLPRITVLIGTNNSGKTSLLKALHLALGDYSRKLSDEDFHIGADDKPVQEILIDVRVIPIGADSSRVPSFSNEWKAEFGDRIKAEANGNQYVAIRTRSKVDTTKGGFVTSRVTLERWTGSISWQTEKNKETKIFTPFLSISFIAIEAQRDLHQELKEKSSWIGKVLSYIDYDDTEIDALESLIEELNEQTVAKSPELTNLKTELERLSQSFEGSGNVEITPFPKKIRDLFKNFSAHVGESADNTFPMEYHGMGTRSWASMLTVKAFTNLIAKKYAEEVKPFFPILAAEEPEAHLHPNAQKTLYRQLAEYKGQVIVSTHSPYIAAMADQSELRYLKKLVGGTVVRQLRRSIQDEERCRLKRAVIHSRGEVLFSKALVVCEGETEEQALPLLFHKYFGSEAFELGISFIGVGGAGNYLPFLTFAYDFSIPIFIFSDGESQIVKALQKTYSSVYGETDINTCDYITILDSTDFERYLISSGFKSTIESAIQELDGDTAIQEWIDKRNNTHGRREKTNKPRCSSCNQDIYANNLRDYQESDGYDKALIEMIDECKPKYAPLIASKLCELSPEKLPQKIIDLFQKIKTNAGI